jgi:hypothetical protein
MDVPMGRPYIYVKAVVPNAYNVREETTLYIKALIPTWVIPDQKHFLWWLQQRFIEMETHECLEFFKFDGKPLFDPHDPIEPVKKETNDIHSVATPRGGRQEIVESDFPIYRRLDGGWEDGDGHPVGFRTEKMPLGAKFSKHTFAATIAPTFDEEASSA